jgi:hypothetical protein
MTFGSCAPFADELPSENSATVCFFPAGTAEIHARLVVFRAGTPGNHASVSFFLHRPLKFMQGQLFSIQRRLKPEPHDLLVMHGSWKNLQRQFFSRMGKWNCS